MSSYVNRVGDLTVPDEELTAAETTDAANPNAPKAVKTRKQHTCAYCGKKIPKGTPHIIKESGFCMGDFWKRYSCLDCQPYISEFWGWQGCESESLEADFDEFMRENHYEEWVTDDDD